MDKSELYLRISWWNFKILTIEQKMLKSSNVHKIDYLQRNESRFQDFHQQHWILEAIQAISSKTWEMFI